MLYLQASASNDAALAEHLAEASSRVSAVGRAYERLAYDENVETIAVDAYLKDVCADAISRTASSTILPIQVCASMPIGPAVGLPGALLVHVRSAVGLCHSISRAVTCSRKSSSLRWDFRSMCKRAPAHLIQIKAKSHRVHHNSRASDSNWNPQSPSPLRGTVFRPREIL